MAHLLLGEEVPGACRFVDGIIEAVAQPHADGAIGAGRIGSPAIGIGFGLLRRGVRTAGFHRLLLFQRPAGARLELLDLGFEPACIGVELLASLDAGIVGRVFAARLLHVALESVKLAQLAGDGGVKRRHGPRRRLLPSHGVGRHPDRAIQRGERRKQRTGDYRQAARLEQNARPHATRTARAWRKSVKFEETRHARFSALEGCASRETLAGKGRRPYFSFRDSWG